MLGEVLVEKLVDSEVSDSSEEGYPRRNQSSDEPRSEDEEEKEEVSRLEKRPPMNFEPAAQECATEACKNIVPRKS